MLREIAVTRSDWAGIPLPLDGERLVIEPNYPNAEALSKIGAPPEPPDDGWREINSWHSSRRRCRIVVMRSPEGRITWGAIPEVHHLKHDLSTLGCSDAWGIEQEHTALQLLGTLLSHRAFKQYLLTGMFLETSKRSGMTYLFRKLRPTVVIKADKAANTTRIVCALCLHPIAYYAGSWAGAMCPTDDVIAHLMLMRGDEPMLWRRANHHPSWAPEAGL
jgi:hypothetical protein